jgi:hypothetical protein
VYDERSDHKVLMNLHCIRWVGALDVLIEVLFPV